MSFGPGTRLLSWRWASPLFLPSVPSPVCLCGVAGGHRRAGTCVPVSPVFPLPLRKSLRPPARPGAFSLLLPASPRGGFCSLVCLPSLPPLRPQSCPKASPLRVLLTVCVRTPSPEPRLCASTVFQACVLHPPSSKEELDWGGGAQGAGPSHALTFPVSRCAQWGWGWCCVSGSVAGQEVRVFV